MVLPIQDVISKIRASKKEKFSCYWRPKVPGSMYKMADWNISVTSQPHSEISALSIFLHEFF